MVRPLLRYVCSCNLLFTHSSETSDDSSIGELRTDSDPELKKTKDEIEAWLVNVAGWLKVWEDFKDVPVDTIYGIVSRVPLKFLCP